MQTVKGWPYAMVSVLLRVQSRIASPADHYWLETAPSNRGSLMNRGLEPEERRGLMSQCIVSCRQFNSLFPSLTVPSLRVFKSDWRSLAYWTSEALCLLLGQ